VAGGRGFFPGFSWGYHNLMIRLRPGLLRKCVASLTATVLIGAAACSAPRDPITVAEGYVTVENQTDREWRNVKVTVNHYYTGGVPSLAPGGRLNAPLSQMQTAYGQRFDRGRQSVYKVDVTATDSDGKTVTLTWGTDRK
jgi:hypothetical protein